MLIYLLYIDFDKKATIILCKLRDIASIVRWARSETRLRVQ